MSEKKSSSRAVATKALVIEEYRRRLRDNIRSLNDNFHHILLAAKVGIDDRAYVNQNARMTDFETGMMEMQARAALIVRACDELQKLSTDIKEFLILHDFDFLTKSVRSASTLCDVSPPRHVIHFQDRLETQRRAHTALRADIVGLIVDIDKEVLENFNLRE